MDDLISRLRAYIAQREKIRDGGDTVTECNGEPLTLTDLREAATSLEVLREDTERLDFIERTYSGMTNRERYLPVRMGWGKGYNGRTLREACDKYMERKDG